MIRNLGSSARTASFTLIPNYLIYDIPVKQLSWLIGQISCCETQRSQRPSSVLREKRFPKLSFRGKVLKLKSLTHCLPAIFQCTVNRCRTPLMKATQNHSSQCTVTPRHTIVHRHSNSNPIPYIWMGLISDNPSTFQPTPRSRSHCLLLV